MNPDRWQQITEAFHVALDRDAAARAAYLDEACAGDPALRAEVDAMIAAHLRAGSFGKQPLGVPPGLNDAGSAGRCSHCGSPLLAEPGLPGMCPQCLLGLALQEPDASAGRFHSGRIIGDRYQVLEALGHGGMGDVFKAFDLKLRVHVALKAIRADRAASERAREFLRSEVRSAREVMSPNVCRIFDLVAADEEEFVSMEYIDGLTLAERLRGLRPVPLHEAREIASQFLSGLEAIHRAGLVHRDLKPENIMITTAGRVVVMDFGLASMATDDPGRTISGTPAYMAPEQARGEGVDPRADVFAAGVVLTEMLAASGELALGTREDVWRAVREVPPRVPDGPWKPLLKHALASKPEERFSSAHELARAVEGIALRLPGFDQRDPYPGLASFTADNAEFFFGREIEVETVLKKLERPRLLALIGPSGAGKSSFLRAGLVTSLPDSWMAAIAKPGTRPFQSLAHALAPLLAGDADGVHDLLRFEEDDVAIQLFQRLRRRQHRTLVIIDQFEELFTLSPVDVQASFARMLGRLVVEADVRVIVSLRDDFLIHCQAHDALLPAFADVTPLGLLGVSSMRRALVQPALACGYRFEDEALVDEMIRDVSRERGALPLLAFAASRLWEKRDRERGLLTREAYKEIGGVGGALAQHAEVTLERIGRKRIPLVRELFRNLVTSQGTRAVRERDELLSVFDAKSDTIVTRAEAEDVINALVDARLLNAYVQAGQSGDNQQLLEIVHESLLFAWPRLVQWRAQEADGAQIRDQLRLAAQLWRERGRSEDLLWSGTTYRDFVVWRERYPGPLSANESAFARASEQLVLRGRRRKRVATASLLVAAALVSVITFGLWRQSESSLQRAEAETLRSEAGKLLVMAEREAERYPTAALAYAIKSLELTDTEPARLLALKILQQGPVARIAEVASLPGFEHSAMDSLDFSPDGEWIAWAGQERVETLDRRGQARLVLGDFVRSRGWTIHARFTLDSKALIANRDGDVRLWSIPDGAELYRGRTEPGDNSIVRTARDAFLLLTSTPTRALAQTWPLPPGRPSLIGSFELTGPLSATAGAVAYVWNNEIHVRSLRNSGARPRLVARTAKPPTSLALSPDGTVVASADSTEQIRFWSAASNSSDSIGGREAPAAVVGLNYSDSGKALVAVSFGHGYPMYSVFDLTGPENLVPTLLAKGDTNNGGAAALDPSGQWLATSHGTEVAFWPLAGPWGRVLELGQPARVVDFVGDGSRVLTLNLDNSLLDRPLQGGTVRQVRPATTTGPSLIHMIPDPGGRRVALSGTVGQIEVVDLATGVTQSMPGVPSATLLGKPAFSEDGRMLAVGVLGGRPDTFRLHLWNLETGETTTFGPFVENGAPTFGIASVQFVGNDQIYASVSGKGIVAVDLRTGASRLISNVFGSLVLSRGGQFGFVTANVRGTQGRGDRPLTRIEFERGMSSHVRTHGNAVSAVAIDAHDRWVATGSFDGTIRIGPVSGDDPHVLLSQEGGGAIYSLSFSRDGRWIAASGEGFRLTVWPVPDLSKRPFHRRPLDSLLKTLKTFTNLGAVPDSAAPNGYKLEPGVFPGWANPPEW